ncbi:MAG: preprotein translocase subunit SecG [Candidatus Cloacimonetes bacterium]|nr:preprotein translocase subunit SecG [Candidatus Cloacimonadota bacterium]
MILYTLALIVHAIICIALVLVILAQTSKGGLDANLGGAAMNVFGGSGASKMLKKWTQILAILFAASCILLAFLVKNVNSAHRNKAAGLQSELQDTEAPDPSAPAAAEETIPIELPQAE